MTGDIQSSHPEENPEEQRQDCVDLEKHLSAWSFTQKSLNAYSLGH